MTPASSFRGTRVGLFGLGVPPILLNMPPQAANGWYLLTVPIGFALTILLVAGNTMAQSVRERRALSFSHENELTRAHTYRVEPHTNQLEI